MKECCVPDYEWMMVGRSEALRATVTAHVRRRGPTRHLEAVGSERRQGSLPQGADGIWYDPFKVIFFEVGGSCNKGERNLECETTKMPRRLQSMDTYPKSEEPASPTEWTLSIDCFAPERRISLLMLQSEC